MSAADPFLSTEFIYLRAPYPSCHASTIVEVAPGHLAAAWFGGSREGALDVCIYVSHCRRDGRWSEPAIAATGHVDFLRWFTGGGPARVDQPLPEPFRHDPHRFSCYNPVLFKPRNGPLMLFYKAGMEPAAWFGLYKTSTDGGHRWSNYRRMPEGLFGPIKDKPIQLADKTLLCPSSSEAQGWTVHFESTPDLGRSWMSTGPLNDTNEMQAIQPTLLTLSPGVFRAIGRTKQKRLFAIDGSQTESGVVQWGPMRLTDLPNPDSGIDAVTLRDGRHLLVYNPVPEGRTPLAVAISDDAERWHDILVLETAPGEYSYPAVIQAADGLVHITYTWHRTRIKHVVLDPRDMPL